MRKPTIYEALYDKLGREPTNAELKAEVGRIGEESLVQRGTAGRLPFQRGRGGRKIKPSVKTGSKKESQFVDYLLTFYGPGGVYTGPGDVFHKPMTRDEARSVATVLGSRKDFEGDSFDREKARDLVLNWRGKIAKYERPSHATVKNYGAAKFRVTVGGLSYRVVIECDWTRGGFTAKLISEGIGVVMEPNGVTPGDALDRLVRDLRAGDKTDQQLASRIAQFYWGAEGGHARKVRQGR